MRRSSALLAILILGPALTGCSGFKPFWQSDTDQAAQNRAAERSVDGPLTLARLAEQRGNTLEAERLYKSILEKSPDNPAVMHRLGIMQSRKGRFEEANAYFDRALQIKPEDPTLICDAGYCLYLQNRLDQAEALFRQVLEIDPNYKAATNNLALVLAEKGDDRGAFDLFRQTGTEARAHANMGFVYSRRGDIEKAKEAYGRALSIDPQMIAAAEALVQLAQFQREAKAAVAQARIQNADWAANAAEAERHHRLVNHETPDDVRKHEVRQQRWHSSRLPEVTPPQAAPPEGVTAQFVSPEDVQQHSAPQQPIASQPISRQDAPPIPAPSAFIPPEPGQPQYSPLEAASSQFVTPEPELPPQTMPQEPTPSAGFSWASSP